MYQRSSIGKCQLPAGSTSTRNAHRAQQPQLLECRTVFINRQRTGWDPCQFCKQSTSAIVKEEGHHDESSHHHVNRLTRKILFSTVVGWQTPPLQLSKLKKYIVYKKRGQQGFPNETSFCSDCVNTLTHVIPSPVPTHNRDTTPETREERRGVTAMTCTSSSAVVWRVGERTTKITSCSVQVSLLVLGPGWVRVALCNGLCRLMLRCFLKRVREPL